MGELPIEIQIGKDDLLVRIVVPLIPRVLLIVPDVFARVRIESHDRGREQVIFFPRIADFARPWITIPGTDVHQIQLRDRTPSNPKPFRRLRSSTTRRSRFSPPSQGSDFQTAAMDHRAR